MADRHRAVQRRITGTTAAARILRPIRQDAPKPMPWHDEAWGFRDVVGELRFAEMWLSNAFSRSNLFAARRPEPGKEPEPVESGPAADLVSRLAGGPGGQAALLRSFGPFLLVPGVGYMVGEPKQGAERYVVVDSDDIRLGTNRDQPGGRGYDIRVGEGVGEWRSLAPGTVVTKIHRPHPRRRWEPDSPTRAALTILRELVLLTQHVEATALSRLAGAGIQAWPAEIDFEGGWDKFIQDMVAAVTKPAKDRSLASALVPFPVKMPGDAIQKWKEGFVSYATTFDEKSIELREEAITRLGNAMDMPRQVLTGEQRNHWGDWQVEEAGLKMHVEPGLETICDGLTVGFMEPGLAAGTEKSAAIRRDLEAVERKTPDGEWLVWYDTSDLKVRPDRGEAVTEAYDRWEASGDDLRKEKGISEATAADPKDPEVERRIWLSLLDSDFAGVALVKLGLATEEEIAGSTGGGAQPAPGGLPETRPVEEAPNERTLPGTEPQQSEPPSTPGPPRVQAPAAAGITVRVNGTDGVDLEQLGRDAADALADQLDLDVPDHPPAITPGVAIVAALDGVVHRALERAGRRALNKMPRQRNGNVARTVGGQECPAERLHTCTQVAKLLPLDVLFAEAWERVPEIADRLDLDADVLAATCDAYVRMLVTTQTEHSWDGLARALGVCPCGAEPDVTAVS